MNNNELNRMSDLIWSELNTIENSKKSRSEQIELVKKRVLELYQYGIKIGRGQILSHFKVELENIERRGE